MDKIKDNPCSAKVSDDWYTNPCSNKANVCIEGIYYCGIHNPVNVKKRYEKMEKRYREENEVLNYKRYAVEYCKRKGLSLKDLEEDSKKNGKEKQDG